MTIKTDVVEAKDKVTTKAKAMADKAEVETKKTAEKTAGEVKKAVAEVEPTVEKAKAAAKKTTKKVVAEAEEMQEEVTKGLKKYAEYVTKPAHKVYVVSLGAVSMAQDEFVDLYHRLLDEGTAAEKEGRKLLHRAEKASKDEFADVQDKVEENVTHAADRVEATVEKVLARLNVPTKGDIERLSKKITELSEKVDELKMSNGHKS